MHGAAMRVGILDLDESTGEVRHESDVVHMQPKPFALLHILAAQMGHVLTRDHLMDSLWPDQVVSKAALSSAVREVRRALRALDVSEVVELESLRSRGYRLNATEPGGAPSLPSTLRRRAVPSGLVGRDGDLSRLQSAFADVTANRPRTVLITGPAGIGKTRLVTDFGASLSSAEVLWGSCFGGQKLPFDPWAQMVRSFCGGRARGELRSLIQPLAPELALVVPSIRSLFDEIEPTTTRDPELARLALLDCLAELFERMADHQPCVLVLDDIQWADSSSLHLISRMVRGASTGRVLLIAIERTGEGAPVHPQFSGDSAVEILSLAPLSESDSKRFLANLDGRDEVDGRWDDLCSVARGNPFFLRELHRHTREAQSAAELPESIERLILRRLNHRSSDARELVSCASVCGAEFRLGCLEAIAGANVVDATAALGELERADLISPAVEQSDTYHFAHELVRRTVYDQLPAARRAQLHLAVGQWLETALGVADHPEAALNAIGGEAASNLARHFEVSAHIGGAGRAFAYRKLAAAEARRRLSFQEVVHHLSRAARILQEWVATDNELRQVGDRERCDLLIDLADAASKVGDLQTCNRATHAALPLARALDDPLPLARLATTIPFMHWIDESILDVCDEALGRLGEAPTTQRALVLASLAQRLADKRGERDRRMALLDEALEITRLEEHREGRWYVLDACLATIGGPDGVARRERHAAEYLDLSRGERGGWATYAARGYRHGIFLQQGLLEKARNELRAIEELAALHTWPRFRWCAASLRCMHALVAGRLGEAEEQAGVAASLVAEWRLEVGPAQGIQSVALRREQGRLKECLGLAPALASMVSSDGWAPQLVESEIGDAEMLRRTLAEVYRDRSGPLERDNDGIWVYALCWLAEVSAKLEESVFAETARAELALMGNTWATGRLGVVTSGSVHRTLGLLELLQDRPKEAVVELERAAQSHHQPGATLLRLWTTFDLARARSRLGRKKDRDLVSRAMAETHEEACSLGMVELQSRIEAHAR